MVRVAVIILNWNGAKLLKEFLPSVVKNTDPALGKVIVVDNASTDDSVRVMEDKFPEVSLIRFDKNYGFAGGYNRAIELADQEIVVLLNSDVEVAPGWLEPLVDVLDSSVDVAAVQPKILSYKDRHRYEYAGAGGGYLDRLGFPFCRGRILNSTEEDCGQYDDAVDVFWCSGAALCIRREVYQRLGGLDESFFAHMEEIDLCWRVRNQGLRLKICPSAVVYHLGGGSLPMNHPHKLFLNYRNNLLMLYKNLSFRQWRRVLWQRRVLDGGAMMLFLLKGEWANACSVIRAYREFGRMKKNYHPRNPEREDDCIYPGSLLIQYYFRHIRTFSQLWK